MRCPRCNATITGPADRCPFCGSMLAGQRDPVSPAPLPMPGDLDVTKPPSSASGVNSAVTAGSGPLAPGQSFGTRYHIVRQLGVGGMGAVYQAWDDELGEGVAIKVIRPEIAADAASAADLERRFKRELSLARQVTHRNVVRIHDLGEIQGIKYITMPLINGEDLATVLRRSGRLPVPRALELARQIVAGLSAAHEAGVVHRDLKPANVMVEEDRAVIMDFGIARSAGTGGSTVLGTVIGTVEYMAPEQARGEAVDQRADIYAVGLILYDMLIGRRQAARTDSVVAELMARMQSPPPAPRSVDPEIPEALDAIVTRCLQPDAAARYQTAAELAADLDTLDANGHLLAGRTTSAMRVPIVTAGRSRRPRRWVLMAAAAAAVAVGVGAFTLRDRIGGSRSAAVATSEPLTLAILPFRNASGDPSLDWLTTSFADMLHSQLGQSSQLRTVSPERLHQILKDLRFSNDSSFDQARLRQLADFSNADTLLWGQYVRFGTEIRITATLENVKEQKSSALAASAPSEASLLTAIASMADSVRAAIAPTPGVMKELQANASKPSTQSVQALRSYTEGSALSRDGKHADALRQFQSAVEADPNFALAYSRLAETHARLNHDEDAQRVSRRAVDLAQGLPAREKYLVEARHARIVGDNRRALEAYRNLAKISPEDIEVDFALGGLYDAMGEYDRAHEHLSKVLHRDPKYLDALILMGRVEIRRSKWQAALDRLNPALSLAISFENDEAKANALHSIGAVYRLMSKPEEALRYYQQALDIKRRIGQKGGLATTLHEIGHAQKQLGNADAAMSSYNDALALRRETDDRRGIGSSLIDLGVFYTDRGQYDTALALYKEALQIQRELGNVDFEALCLNNIGNVYLFKGQHDDAVTYLRLVLELREKSNNVGGSALALHNLGEAYAKMGQFDQSLAHYLRSLELWRKSDQRRSAAMELHYMATVFEYQGRHGAAVSARAEALKTLRDLRDRSVYLAGVMSGYGRALNQVGRFDEADKHLDEAHALAIELKHKALIARTSNYKGEGALYRRDTRTARALFEQALPIAQSMKNAELMALSRLNLAKAMIEEGRPQEAAAILREASTAAHKAGMQYIAADASVALGEALLAMRQTPQAIAELRQVLSRAEKLGMQPLAARSHALLARAYRPGDRAAAARHAREARRILDAIVKDASGSDPLKRADLRTIHTEASQ